MPHSHAFTWTEWMARNWPALLLWNEARGLLTVWQAYATLLQQ